MQKYHVPIWMFLLIAFIIIFALHVIETRQPPFIHRKRSFQLLAVIGVSFVLIALYDWQVRETQERLEELQVSKSILNLPALISPILQSKESGSAYYPPVVPNSQNEGKTPSIQDIFSAAPNEFNAKHDIDNIKTRYEEIFVTYFLMQKCKIADDSDYPLIFAELQKETESTHAPIRLQNDILTAAQGSYQELYSQSDCLKPDMEASINQYTGYISSLSGKERANPVPNINQVPDKITDKPIEP